MSHAPIYVKNIPDKKPNQKKRGKSKPIGGGRPSYRFVDRMRLRAVGGMGGKGSLSMERLGGPKRRPDGGHGGHGGHVVLVAHPREQTLRYSRPHVSAQGGTHGSSQDKYGRNGPNKVVHVPCGVVIRRVLDHHEEWDAERHCVVLHKAPEEDDDDEEEQYNDLPLDYDFWDDTDFQDDDGEDGAPHVAVQLTNPNFDDDYDSDDDYEDEEDAGDVADNHNDYDYDNNNKDDDDDDEDETPVQQPERHKVVLADLDEPGSWVVVARGGRGGLGNSAFAKDTRRMPSPTELVERAQGKEGEVAYLELELKLIADLGLVGYPNAGKSSLLAAMSRAAPEIAPYPFTTLHPLLGIIEYRDGFRIKAADVPGLVDGASEGKGRGHDFLRHLERTKALVYVVDAAGTDGRDPVEDLRALVKELRAYHDGDLVDRRAMVVANKVDLLSEAARDRVVAKLERVATKAGINFDGKALAISAGVTGQGLKVLSQAMRQLVTRVDQEREMENEEERAQ